MFASPHISQRMKRFNSVKHIQFNVNVYLYIIACWIKYLLWLEENGTPSITGPTNHFGNVHNLYIWKVNPDVFAFNYTSLSAYILLRRDFQSGSRRSHLPEAVPHCSMYWLRRQVRRRIFSTNAAYNWPHLMTSETLFFFQGYQGQLKKSHCVFNCISVSLLLSLFGAILTV